MKILRYLIFFLVGLLAIYLLTALFAPKNFHVERSIVINAKKAYVFAQVTQLDNWPLWSAWQKGDSSIKYIYSGPKSGVGATSSWTSKNSGDGNMTITEVDPGNFIKMDLFFMEDGSPSEATWSFEDQKGKIKVTWELDGHLLFFIRPMGLFMDRLVGKDFEEGLKNLKQYCEYSEAESQ